MKTLTAKTTSVVIVLTIAAISSAWLAVRAKAQDQLPFELGAFGVTGIALGQTARLNVVTVGVPNDMPIELMFLDRQGTVLSKSVERVAPGHAVFLDLHFIPGAQGNRLPFRALAIWGAKPNRGYIIPTLELIDDTTGRTTVVLVNPEG